MQKNVIQNWIFLATCLLACACRKNVTTAGYSNSQLALINYSEHLNKQMAGNGLPCFILIDTPDTSVSNISDAYGIYPWFSSNSPPSNIPNIPLQYANFPALVSNASLPNPWMLYMNVPAGNHTFALTDTAGHANMISGRFSTSTTSPASVFFADSLGTFHYWVQVDTEAPKPGAIDLRVAQLSPDAGPVFFTLNEQPAMGFPNAFKYGDITPFISLNNPVSDTLVVRFYSIADSTNVLARAFLYANPGHSYTMVLEGYQNNQTYQDPWVPGSTVSISQDINILINKNN